MALYNDFKKIHTELTVLQSGGKIYIMYIIFVDKIDSPTEIQMLLISGTRPQKRYLVPHAIHISLTLPYS